MNKPIKPIAEHIEAILASMEGKRVFVVTPIRGTITIIHVGDLFKEVDPNVDLSEEDMFTYKVHNEGGIMLGTVAFGSRDVEEIRDGSKDNSKNPIILLKMGDWIDAQINEIAEDANNDE